MRVTSKLGVEFGQYDLYREYEVHVSRQGNDIRVVLNSERRGGSLQISTEAAARLGYALLLASSGPIRTEISFAVTEPSGRIATQ
jgi:hypothetical protein